MDVNSELPRQNLAVKAAEAAFIPKIEELHEKLLKICRKSPRAKSAEEVDLILSELIPEGTVLVSSTARWQSPWIQRYLPKFSAKLNPQYVDIEELSRTLSVLGYAVPDAPPQIQSNSLQKAELDAERFRGLMKNLCPSTST